MDSDKIKNEILNLADKYFKEEFNQKPFVPLISPIPVAGKVLDENDLKNLLISSLDLWLTSGEHTEKFEKMLKEKTKHRHALFVNSGSSANLLAISSLKILNKLNDGDEIITCAVNFPTTLNPIIQNNLVPVLVDAEEGTYNINPNLIREKISKRTRGIVLAHTLGNPINLNEITEICKDYNLFLMEDMCDAFGSTYDDKNVGTFGDVATLSFYPAHHMTTGEGGAVLTNNAKLKKIIESLRDWGRDCYCPPGHDNTCKKRYDWQLGNLPHGYDHKYIYSHIGYNLKATDMQAAIGVSQLEKIDKFISIRKNNFKYLYEKFNKFDVFDLPKWYPESDPSWFGFPITLNDKAKFERKELLEFYSDRKIGTRLMFAGNIIKQPAYLNSKIISDQSFPVADKVMNNTFWLGLYPGLNKEMLEFVYESTETFLISKN